MSSPSPQRTRWKVKAGGRWLLDLYAWLARTRALGLAAETAFWLFLSLVPLMAIVGIIAARLSLENWESLSPILGSLPPAAQELVTSELTKVAERDSSFLGLAGVLVTLWLASSGVHAIFDALQVEISANRSWLLQRVLSMVTCVGLAVTVTALAVLGPGLEAAFSQLNPWFPTLSTLGEPTLLGRSVRDLLRFAIVFGQTYLLYWVGVPAVVRRNIPLVPGAITAVFLQVVLNLGYGQFVACMAGGAMYTTGLAIIGVVLTGLYLSVVALLIGAAVNLKLGSDRVNRTGELTSELQMER